MAGVTRARLPIANPPIAGRSQIGTPLLRNSSSVIVTPRMIEMPSRAHSMPSARIGM